MTSQFLVRMAMSLLSREKRILGAFGLLFEEPVGDGMVPIRVVSRMLGMQNQYASRYLREVRGIRYTSDPHGNYHAIRIDMRDVPKLVRAVADHQLSTGHILEDRYERILEEIQRYRKS